MLGLQDHIEIYQFPCNFSISGNCTAFAPYRVRPHLMPCSPPHFSSSTPHFSSSTPSSRVRPLIEKCGGEHGIRQGRTRRGKLDRGRKRRIPLRRRANARNVNSLWRQIYIINSVDKMKLPRYTPPPTQYNSFV